MVFVVVVVVFDVVDVAYFEYKKAFFRVKRMGVPTQNLIILHQIFYHQINGKSSKVSATLKEILISVGLSFYR